MAKTKAGKKKPRAASKKETRLAAAAAAAPAGPDPPPTEVHIHEPWDGGIVFSVNIQATGTVDPPNAQVDGFVFHNNIRYPAGPVQAVNGQWQLSFNLPAGSMGECKLKVRIADSTLEPASDVVTFTLFPFGEFFEFFRRAGYPAEQARFGA